MTEVDTVMHEGGTAPVPAATRQITTVEESSDTEVVTAAVTNNGDVETESKSTIECRRNSMKITESIATSTTATTTASTTSSSTSLPNDDSSTNKKIRSETGNVASKSDNTPTTVDGDDDDNGAAAAVVTTTTTEQECEEDSQVTSSSTVVEGIDAARATDTEPNLNQQKSPGVTATSEQSDTTPSAAEVAKATEAASPNPAPLLSGALASAAVETAAENSNSHVDGNDLSVAEHDEDEDEGEGKDEADNADAKIEAKTKTSTEEDPNASVATKNLNDNAQRCESVNEIRSEKSQQGTKESKEINSDPDDNDHDDEEEESSVLNSEKTPSQSNNETTNSDVLSESQIPASPSPAATNANAKQNCIKEKSDVSHVDLVEKMDVDTEEETDPLGMDNELSIVNSFEAKNGLTESAGTKDLTNNNNSSNNNNNGIVDLDDDSDDDDDDDDDDDMNSNDDKQEAEQSNGSKPQETNTASKKSKSICSDSDGAVVIGSDSENEVVNPSPKIISKATVKLQNSTPSKPSQDESDDDDDCVVIEDDSPLELTPKANDLVRRKSAAFDSENNSDDSQPPNKRQRRVGGGAIQLTIKDARSLLPNETTLPPAGGGGGCGNGNGKKSLGLNEGTSVYPINIAPAGGNITIQSGPPKLTPIGGISLPMMSGTLPGGVGAGLNSNMNTNTNANSNSNLLPGLTDDMFVLEAPSFIVPYIYEKPPSDSLKDIVKEIEMKYELSRDDLTEADKSDEFDMMTEQNKEDRDPQSINQANKKKKRRRFAADVDDSWSEESDDDDDDDDDDDSEAGVRTKVLIKEATDDLTALKGAIKPAAAVAQSMAAAASTTSAPSKPGQENYFESPLGKFFMDIGVGLVQEFVQTDLIRLQKRKMRKSLSKNMKDFERAIAALSGNLEASKKKNSAFKFTMKRCEFCNFKSESALAMAHHYETPHMNGPLYKCNFCTFEIRNATEIVYHMEAMHNIKARLIKPLPYHQCPNCGFEDNGKAKLARHQPVCAKKFRADLNLAPPNDWEAPAKIPRIKPRHGLVGTATAYQAMAAQAAAQKAAIATIQQQQQQQQQARNLQAAAIAAQNAVNKIRGRPPVLAKVGVNVGPNGTAAVMRGAATGQAGPRAMATNVVLPNNYQLPGNQIISATNSMHTGKKAPSLPGQPSISITPLPRQSTTTPQAAAAAATSSSSPSTSKTTLAGMKPGRNPTGGKAQFVICEICDGYIKDLEQLRNHMQWMHEVKIHPKMIYNRPPLNCQKCQFRFFTDQGLERHLLGSHGLVTSSMQEAANKGKDAGRCPVCGRMYQWKLLNHVARDHHMTLKPAHLSYKCTVCTATFGMYKQFETHVYTAHSTVAKKAMDSKKNNAASATAVNASGSAGANASAASSSSSGTSQRSGGGGISTSASNDALLKPLKINDEITIIPQPASKPRITNMESHVID